MLLAYKAKTVKFGVFISTTMVYELYMLILEDNHQINLAVYSTMSNEFGNLITYV